MCTAQSRASPHGVCDRSCRLCSVIQALLRAVNHPSISHSRWCGICLWGTHAYMDMHRLLSMSELTAPAEISTGFLKATTNMHFAKESPSAIELLLKWCRMQAHGQCLAGKADESARSSSAAEHAIGVEADLHMLKTNFRARQDVCAGCIKGEPYVQALQLRLTLTTVDCEAAAAADDPE